MVAESGVMRVSKDKQFLEFILKNGWRYNEKGPRGVIETEFTRMGFKEYKKVFDLKSFQMNKTEDSAFYDPKMLSIRQLNLAIDSLDHIDTFYAKKAKLEVSPYLRFTRYADTGWTKIATPLPKVKPGNIFPDSLNQQLIDAAANQLATVKGSVAVMAEDYKAKYLSMQLHEIEWHKKFTLSVACLVMFLIGAPLGSIIRKGGLGTPMVFAIVFFVLFHLLNTFGEKFVRSGQTNALVGMWLSTFILVPVSVFLIYKAMHDSQLFNQEFYYRNFKGLRKFLATFKKQKNDEHA